jgi:hypothetical protein
MAHKTPTIAIALTAIALMLSACEENAGGMTNSGICADFTAHGPAATDAAAPMDDCVRRWAYSLAGARDTADIVADSAVAACGAVLTRWNQAALSQGGLNQGGMQPQGREGNPPQTLSIDTGQPTNALAEHAAFAHRQAQLYVVEARAGHCRPPTATKGVPAGT